MKYTYWANCPECDTELEGNYGRFTCEDCNKNYAQIIHQEPDGLGDYSEDYELVEV